MKSTGCSAVRPCRGAFLAFILLILAPACVLAVNCEELRYRGADYSVCGVEAASEKLQLFWKQPDGTRIATIGALRKRLREEGQELAFATNAGIFSPEMAPLGLHIENGRTLVPLNSAEGAGNFFLKPNGVFFLGAAGPRIVETSDFRSEGPSAQLATQSGPLLVSHGAIHPIFKMDSSNRTVRSGVGVAGKTVFFAISRADVSFYDFAALFRDRLRCADALYLDGAISKFYSGPGSEAGLDSPFAGILAVTRTAGSAENILYNRGRCEK